MPKWKEKIHLWNKILMDYYKNDRNSDYLLALINGGAIWNDCHRIQFWELGKENAGRTVGYISFPHEWCPTAGFFALFNRTLCGLYFADRMGYLPVVANWDGCPYEEETPVNGSPIVFEYYFESLSEITVNSALNSYSVVPISNPNMDIVLMETNSSWYHTTDEFIRVLGELCGRYVRFQRNIEQRLHMDMMTLCVENPQNILGIHFRGTDYGLDVKGHPLALTVSSYFDYIDDAISRYGFTRLFLATDDANAVLNFQEKYGDRVIMYSDVMRSSDKVSVAFVKNQDKGPFERGYEVIRDAYTLSICGGLIVGQSQVGVAARIFKVASKQKYKLCRIIDKGINTKGIDWVKYYKEEIKGTEEYA